MTIVVVLILVVFILGSGVIKKMNNVDDGVYLFSYGPQAEDLQRGEVELEMHWKPVDFTIEAHLRFKESLRINDEKRVKVVLAEVQKKLGIPLSDKVGECWPRCVSVHNGVVNYHLNPFILMNIYDHLKGEST